jgi:hypothetical protein
VRDRPKQLRNGAANRCAICEGRFGLYYAWRSAVCSRKCSERFKARDQADRK